MGFPAVCGERGSAMCPQDILQSQTFSDSNQNHRVSEGDSKRLKRAFTCCSLKHKGLQLLLLLWLFFLHKDGILLKGPKSSSTTAEVLMQDTGISKTQEARGIPIILLTALVKNHHCIFLFFYLC